MATAVTALRLVDRGLARRDQPLVELLPPDHRPTAMTPAHTLHHLLSHTSGLTNYHDDDDASGASWMSCWDRVATYHARRPADILPLFKDLPRACRARRGVPLRRRQLHPRGPRDRGGDRSRLWRRRDRRGLRARRSRRHSDRGDRRRPAAARRRLQSRRRTGRPMEDEHLQRPGVRHARRRDDHDSPRPGAADRRDPRRSPPVRSPGDGDDEPAGTQPDRSSSSTATGASWP